MTDLPQNGGYMVAAYVVASVVYLGYTVSLWVRSAKAMDSEQ